MNKKQKNINTVILCVAIGAFAMLFLSGKKKNEKIEPIVSVPVSTSELVNHKVVHCDDNLSNLHIHGHTVLIAGYEKCDPCNIIKDVIRIPASIHCHAYYLDITKSEKHQLVAQALRTSGFPTTYILDEDFRLKSIIKGVANYNSKMESAFSPEGLMEETRLGVDDKEKALGMLSASLKAVLALNGENYDDVYRYARESLDCGEYFFNNWLMHTYYKHENKKDSADHYQAMSLKYTEGANSNIYATLIENYNANR